MPNRQVLTSLFLLVFGLLASSATAESPPVPPQYEDKFAQFVDNRTISEKALNSVGLSNQDIGRSFALIAGVSDYPLMSWTAAGTKLEPAQFDRDELIAYLRDYEFFDEIVVLWDGDMTADNLNYFLQTYFPERLKSFPKSRFLLGYSGHGFSEGGSSFLLTNGARSLDDKQNAISVDHLRDLLRPVVSAAHQSLVLLNSCFGGALVDNRSFGGEYFPRHPGAHAITAGASDELTWHDGKIGKGSVFFEKTFAGLGGAADLYPIGTPDGVITASELFSYLRAEVQISTNQTQNPQFGDIYASQSKGEFFFLNRGKQIEAKVVAPWTGPQKAPFGTAPSPVGWALYKAEIPIEGPAVTLSTNGSFGNNELTISGGTIAVDLAVSVTGKKAQYERIQLRSPLTQQTVKGELSPGFGKPSHPIELTLTLGTVVTTRFPSPELRIKPVIGGKFDLDDFFTSNCGFNCYNLEIIGYWQLSDGAVKTEGRIYSLLNGAGVGADAQASLSAEGFPASLTLTQFAWHANSGGARIGEPIQAEISGIPITLGISYASFPGIKKAVSLKRD